MAPPSLDSVYKNLKFPTVGEWCNCKRLFPVTKRSSKPGVSLQDSGPHFTEASLLESKAQPRTGHTKDFPGENELNQPVSGASLSTSASNPPKSWGARCPQNTPQTGMPSFLSLKDTHAFGPSPGHPSFRNVLKVLGQGVVGK